MKRRSGYLVAWIAGGSVAVLTMSGLAYWVLHVKTAGLTVMETSEVLRNYGLLAAGAVGIPLALWRSVIASHQTIIANETLLNEQYQTAVGTLTDPESNMAGRLAAVYALEAIAVQAPTQYHIPVLAVLCTFLRTCRKDGADDLEGASTTVQEKWEDIEEVLSFVSTRGDDRKLIEKRRRFSVNFAGSVLSEMFLTAVDLSETLAEGVDLSESVCLELNCSRTDLEGANFRSMKACDPNFDQANVSKCNFENVVFVGGSARGTQFAGAKLRGARLINVDLSGASFVPSMITPVPASGLTQKQLDEACADAESPPAIEGLVDEETGKSLMWNERAPTERSVKKQFADMVTFMHYVEMISASETGRQPFSIK